MSKGVLWGIFLIVRGFLIPNNWTRQKNVNFGFFSGAFCQKYWKMLQIDFFKNILSWESPRSKNYPKNPKKPPNNPQKTPRKIKNEEKFRNFRVILLVVFWGFFDTKGSFLRYFFEGRVLFSWTRGVTLKNISVELFQLRNTKRVKNPGWLFISEKTRSFEWPSTERWENWLWSLQR